MVGDHYRFMQIVDASKCVNQRVNIIGFAVETTLPKKTNGTDYSCTARIVDESQPSGIQIVFFAESMKKLPFIENVGNIVMGCNVLINLRNKDNIYAMCNKYSSFALFEGRGSSIQELVPYQVSDKYKPRDEDKKYIMGLRNWSFGGEVKGSHESLFLREINVGEHVNLLCKILHIAEVKKDEWMVYLWDGTDTPPAPIEAKLEDEKDNPLPLALELSPLPRDILCTLPCVGTVLRMIVHQGRERLGINFLKINKWVKLINLRCEAHAALWYAVLTPSSKLCYLPDEDETIMLRQRSYMKRITTKWERMPFTSFPWPSYITETNHPDVPFVTLMDVLTHREVTYKFNCVVRVVALLPWRPEEFRLRGGIYIMRLTLEDPTARIHALLYAEDGVTFFGNCDSIDVLTKKRNMLLGIDGASTGEDVARNPPWIQCCLQSYYTNKDDVWGSRNYRIVDTTCVG